MRFWSMFQPNKLPSFGGMALSGVPATPGSFVSPAFLQGLLSSLLACHCSPSWGLSFPAAFQVSPRLPIQPSKLLQQIVYEDLTGDSVKTLTEVQVDNSHCFPLVYMVSHFIVEHYNVGQVCFPIDESMLDLDGFLVFHVLGNGSITFLGIELKLLPVIPWVLLLACFWM